MRGATSRGIPAALVTSVALSIACSGETTDSGDGGVVDAGAIDSRAVDVGAIDATDASPPPGACSDITGDFPCCPASAVEGGPCELNVTCATPCNQGMHGHMYCSGDTWGAGHGLFPCSDFQALDD